MGSAGVAYMRACLAGDRDGVRVIFDHTDHAELVADLAAVATTMAGLALGDPLQVDLWLCAYLYSEMVAEATG